MDPLGLVQPLLVVLVEFALLYRLAELYVVGLSKNRQHLIVYLPYSFVWVLNQVQDPHQHLTLVQDALETNRVEEIAVETVKDLSNQLWIVLLAQKQSQHRFKQFLIGKRVL